MRSFLYKFLSNHFKVLSYDHLGSYLADSNNNFYPDLVLMNYGSPNESELVSEVRSNLWLRSIPVFVLSDEDKSDLRIAAMAAGATDTLSKPFNPGELLMRINKVLYKIQPGFINKTEVSKSLSA